jgi:hypothetical protein
MKLWFDWQLVDRGSTRGGQWRHNAVAPDQGDMPLAVADNCSLAVAGPTASNDALSENEVGHASSSLTLPTVDTICCSSFECFGIISSRNDSK